MNILIQTTDTTATKEDFFTVILVAGLAAQKKAYRKFQVSSFVGMTSDELIAKRRRHLNRIQCFSENTPKATFPKQILN